MGQQQICTYKVSIIAEIPYLSNMKLLQPDEAVVRLKACTGGGLRPSYAYKRKNILVAAYCVYHTLRYINIKSLSVIGKGKTTNLGRLWIAPVCLGAN